MAKFKVTKVVGGHGYEAQVRGRTVWGATREHAQAAAESFAGKKTFDPYEVERRQMMVEAGVTKPEFTPAHYMAAGLSVAAAHVAAAAQQRKALVEEHRASEHLFKPPAVEEEAVAAGRTPGSVSFRAAGARVAARKEYGGKYGTIRELSPSGKFAVVQHDDGTTASYHLSDLLSRGRPLVEKPLKDPHAEQLARLKEARAEKSIITGPKGGRYYVGPGGVKVYVGPGK